MENEILVREAYLEQETKSLKDQANEMVIKTQEQYEGTGNFLKAVKALQKQIKETFDPIVDAAYKTHREATQKRKEHMDPTIEAEKIVKNKLVTYDTEQERIRKEQQDKLDRQAKAEEERKKKALDARIEKAKLEGKTDKVEALQEKKEEVVVVAPVLAPRAETPKGISYKTVYYVEIEDFAKLSDDYKLPNMTMLNKMAQAGKDNLKIPGVIIKSRKEVASRSK